MLLSIYRNRTHPQLLLHFAVILSIRENCFGSRHTPFCGGSGLISACGSTSVSTITGGHSKKDPRYTQKSIYLHIFTNNTWPYFLWPPIIPGTQQITMEFNMGKHGPRGFGHLHQIPVSRLALAGAPDFVTSNRSVPSRTYATFQTWSCFTLSSCRQYIHSSRDCSWDHASTFAPALLGSDKPLAGPGHNKYQSAPFNINCDVRHA